MNKKGDIGMGAKENLKFDSIKCFTTIPTLPPNPLLPPSLPLPSYQFGHPQP